MEVSGQLPALAAYPLGQDPSTHLTGGWVGPRACLDVVVKRNNPCPLQESDPGCPGHSLVMILTEVHLHSFHYRVI